MSGVSRALENRDMFEASPVLKLLRTDHAPITLGLLAAHLGAEVRTRTAADLYDLLTGDLEELRLHGIDLPRSEEHTSELQSRGQLVCRLLLEKKRMHMGLYS